MWWEEMLKIVGGAAVITAAVAWLVRSIVLHYLSKDIEKYKAELNAELRKIAYEHEVRFSRLHDKRMLFIAELYSKMVEVERAARTAVSELSNPEKEKIIDESLSKFRELGYFFEKGRIYLPPELCDKISAFIGTAWVPIGAVSCNLLEQAGRMGIEKKLEMLTYLTKRSDQDLPAIRETLANEFRQMLGVKQETVS